MSRVLHIDGVEVHHHEADGPVTAVLIFRVGAADEQVSTLGISPLVVHLALDGVDGLESDVGGEARMTYTGVSVEGAPARVVSRLAAICERISEIAAGGLSAGELRRTCRILQAQGGSAMGGQPAYRGAPEPAPRGAGLRSGRRACAVLCQVDARGGR